jgi:hypothetical protein
LGPIENWFEALNELIAVVEVDARVARSEARAFFHSNFQ